MKIIVCGFAFNGPGSYIRSYWNMLDLFVVVIGVLVRPSVMAVWAVLSTVWEWQPEGWQRLGVLVDVDVGSKGS